MKEERKRELIESVDRECKKRFILTRSRILSLFGICFTVIVGIYVIYFSFVMFGVLVRHMPEVPEDGQTSYIITQSFVFVAFLISGLGLFMSLGKFFQVEESIVRKEIVEWYFRRLSERENIETKEEPFLKVLIKMKCSEFDFSLTEIYQEDKSLFQDKALLERLYKVD